MKVLFKKSFIQEAKALPAKEQAALDEIINIIAAAMSFHEIPIDLKKNDWI